MQPRLKQTLKIVAPIAIGAAAILLLFRKDFDPDALRQIELSRRVWIGLAAALIFVAGRELGLTLRFRRLTDSAITLRQALRVTLLCEFTSCVTPTSVGGSAAAVAFLKHEGVSLGRSTTITLITLFFDELFIVVAAPVIFLFIPYKELFGFSVSGSLAADLQITFWVVYAILALWALLLWLGIFVSPGVVRKLLVALFRLPFLRRWHDAAEKVGDEIITCSIEMKGRKTGYWLEVFGATALSWICRFLVVSAIVWGIAAGADQAIVFGRQIIVWILLMFTPTPGGSGVSEWIFKEYYGDILSAGALILIAAVAWRVLTYYIYLVIGVFLLPSLSKKKKTETKSNA